MTRPVVDVLQVSSGTTLGLAQADELLRAELERAGLTVAVARGRYDRLDRWPRQPLLDLYQAAAARVSIERALRRCRPAAIVHPSCATALFEPGARLRRSVVRFDNPLRLSRPGLRNVAQWALERRVMRSARALAPWSPRPTARLLAGAPAGARVIPVGLPIELPADVPAQRDPIVLCYAGNPRKKGLDLIARAWSAIDHAGRRLAVTGVERDRALSFLAGLGVSEPADVEWCGRLPPERFQALCRRAEVYVSASRREEYGAAQLQALAGGCLLVHAAVPGFCDAHELAAELDAGLVAPAQDPAALAGCLGRALARSPEQRRDYRARARERLGPYSAAAVAGVVRDRLVPTLREAA